MFCRKKTEQKYLVFLFLCFLLLTGCGGSLIPQSNNSDVTATPIVASAIDVIATSNSLSAVRANNGASIWSINASDMASPLALVGNHVYYSSGNVAAADLTSGKQLWSDPINGNVTDLQASSTMVYALANNLLSAFDANSGTLKWHVDQVGLDNTGTGISVEAGGASSGSFIISGNTIYTAVSGILTALDATTGSQLWQVTPSTLKGTSRPEVEGLALSSDGKMIVVCYTVDPTASYSAEALYAVRTDSHQEAWHFDPITTTTTTDIFGNNQTSTTHTMALNWFTITLDNHVFFSAGASFGSNGQDSTPPLQDGYHDFVLADGSETWAIAQSGQDRATSAGAGKSFLVGDKAFYSLGGPSGGDVSATMLNNHQQARDTPGSGTYNGLYLDDDVLLALNTTNGYTLTAFNTQNGKQLWQQMPNMPTIFTVGQHVFIQQISQNRQSYVTNVVDLHNGRALWSLTDSGNGSKILNVKEHLPSAHR